MAVNMLAKVMAIVIAWALFATALPSNGAEVAGISLREDTSSPLRPLQADCSGNSPGCDGGYCPPTITSIKDIVDTIDDNREFTGFGMIACHRCATQAERPADYRQGICIYAKNLNKKKVTGRMLKESVKGLIKNGCGKCGSIVVDPATGIPDGQIKVNFMRDTCETGVCPQRDAEVALNAPRSVDAPQKKSVDHVPDVSPRQDDPILAVPLDDCKGSSACKDGPCKPNISQLKFYVDKISSEHPYNSGQQIACVYCDKVLIKDGFCVFLSNVPGRQVNGGEIKETLDRIIANGCQRCGTAQLTRGPGYLKVNYVTEACGEGVCGTLDPRSDLISSRQDDPNSVKTLLRRDCKGSFLCKTNCRKTSIHDLGYHIDKIDGTHKYGDGEQIACVRCNHNNATGLCVFPQKLNGKTVTGDQVKDTFKSIVSNGCKNCGSAPLLMGNDAHASILKIDYTTKTCKHGICGQVSSRQGDPDSATTLVGINCKGSSACGSGLCNVKNLANLRGYIEKIDPASEWIDGEKVACTYCDKRMHTALCAFPQAIKGRTITGKQILEAYNRLVDNGCNRCGSAPFFKGNDVTKGRLTVNYTWPGQCGEGICRTNSERDPEVDEVSRRQDD